MSRGSGRFNWLLCNLTEDAAPKAECVFIKSQMRRFVSLRRAFGSVMWPLRIWTLSRMTHDASGFYEAFVRQALQPEFFCWFSRWFERRVGGQAGATELDLSVCLVFDEWVLITRLETGPGHFASVKHTIALRRIALKWLYTQSLFSTKHFEVCINHVSALHPWAQLIKINPSFALS